MHILQFEIIHIYSDNKLITCVTISCQKCLQHSDHFATNRQKTQPCQVSKLFMHQKLLATTKKVRRIDVDLRKQQEEKSTMLAHSWTLFKVCRTYAFHRYKHVRRTTYTDTKSSQYYKFIVGLYPVRSGNILIHSNLSELEALLRNRIGKKTYMSTLHFTKLCRYFSIGVSHRISNKGPEALPRLSRPLLCRAVRLVWQEKFVKRFNSTRQNEQNQLKHTMSNINKQNTQASSNKTQFQEPQVKCRAGLVNV